MVISHTRPDLVERRDALLRQLGVDTVAEATERAERDELTGEQWLVLDDLRNVEYLLGAREG